MKSMSDIGTCEELLHNVNLEGVDPQGEARAHYEGRQAFVFGGLPDEEVKAVIVYKNRRLLAARVTEITTPSPYRVEPPCLYFGDCTGCQWQHVEYSHQLGLKTKLVSQALEAEGIETTVLPTIPSPQRFGYRNHARFTIGPEGSLGFINRRSRRFVRIEKCLIMHQQINELLQKLQGHCGETTQLSIRYGVNSGQYLIQPALKTADIPVATGQKYYEEILLGQRFRVSAASFFQINTAQAENIVGLIKERLSLSGKERLVDAYAGVGTFAVMLAPYAREVIAIEESNSAMRDASSRPEIPSMRFIEAKTEEVLADLKADALVLDPPRAGCDPSVLTALNTSPPQRLVYVSCEPQTMARDLRALLHGPFTLEEVQPVDLFPQTHHVECLATLTYDAARESSFKARQQLILASASPRRNQVLTELGISFETAAPVEDLEIEGESPMAFATKQALHKARAAASLYKEGTILAADTVVADDEGILGKPASAEEATEFLRRLRGKQHKVITAISLVDIATGEEVGGLRSSSVQMRNMSDEEITKYVASGKPMDKAGAYGIQDEIKPVRKVGGGCYHNVVGLPVCLLLELMLKLGVHPDYKMDFEVSRRCRECRKWFQEDQASG